MPVSVSRLPRRLFIAGVALAVFPCAVFIASWPFASREEDFGAGLVWMSSFVVLCGVAVLCWVAGAIIAVWCATRANGDGTRVRWLALNAIAAVGVVCLLYRTIYGW